MLNTIARLSAASLLLAAPLQTQETAPAAKLAGTWDFSFNGPAGPMTWRVNFQQSGDTLTGMAATDFGSLPVTEGWTSGNEMSFGLVINVDGQVFTVYFSGVVKGDSLAGSIEVPNSGLPLTPFNALRVSNPASSSATADNRVFLPWAPRIDRRHESSGTP